MNPNQALIDSGWKFVAAISGGGQQAFGDLTKHGGMSSCLLEGIIPYAPSSFFRLIRGQVDKIVSPAAARAAAVACYEKAVGYSRGERVFGFASTGSVVKVGGEREGRRHRVHMALQDHERTVGIDLEYRPGRTREEEESLAASCITESIRWGCHVFGDVRRSLSMDDTVKVESHIASPQMQDLFHRVIRKYDTGPSKAIFSSSFNPIHDGHLAIIADASKRLACQVDLELCICNADKPALDYLTLSERIRELQKATRDNHFVGNIIPTNEPLFSKKAALFPKAWFVVGSDTLDRIIDPCYYGENKFEATMSLTRIAAMGCHLLVYPRKGHTMKNDVPTASFIHYVDGFESSEASSTKIRQEMVSA